MSTTIEVSIRELDGFMEEVTFTMNDEGGHSEGTASGLAGDATALALLALIESYCTSPVHPERFAELRARIGALRDLLDSRREV